MNAHFMSRQRKGIDGGHGHFASLSLHVPSQQRWRLRALHAFMSHFAVSWTHMALLGQRVIPGVQGHAD